MSKIKKAKKAEVFVIHYGELPLHMVKGKWNDWKPPKKMYHSESAAKTGMHYIPLSIREDCTIVRYIPEIIKID